MKKFLKVRSIAFYILMFAVAFFAGIYVALIAGAGEGQMLAGGAIVLFWGVIFAGIGFIASFFIVHFATSKTIVRLNWSLFVLLIIATGIAQFRYRESQKVKEERNIKEELKTKPSTTVTPASLFSNLKPIDKTEISFIDNDFQNTVASMGIGFFKPNFFAYPTLYFYGGINMDKLISDHLPTDSVVFTRDENGNPTTTYAPPWLFPEHLKLDYGILFFKAMGVAQDFIKVEVNGTTNQLSYLDKSKGTFFILARISISDKQC